TAQRLLRSGLAGLLGGLLPALPGGLLRGLFGGLLAGLFDGPLAGLSGDRLPGRLLRRPGGRLLRGRLLRLCRHLRLGLEALDDVGQDLEFVLAALVGRPAGAALAAGALARGQLLPPGQVAGAVPGRPGAGDPALKLLRRETADRVVAAVVVELHFALVEQGGRLGTGDLHRSSGFVSVSP